MTSPYQTKSRVALHVFCEDCGEDCHPCDYCQKRVSYGPGCYCKDCDRDFGYAGQMFYPNDPAVKPQFLCFPCQEEREQRVEDPKALREGFVSMEEILNGQHVTGEQFFAALRESIHYGDEEEIGNNPKTMSDAVLKRAFQEVTDDREALYHWAKQNQEWTEHDIALMNGLDDWAENLSTEMQRR